MLLRTPKWAVSMVKHQVLKTENRIWLTKIYCARKTFLPNTVLLLKATRALTRQCITQAIITISSNLRKCSAKIRVRPNSRQLPSTRTKLIVKCLTQVMFRKRVFTRWWARTSPVVRLSQHQWCSSNRCMPTLLLSKAWWVLLSHLD